MTLLAQPTRHHRASGFIHQETHSDGLRFEPENFGAFEVVFGEEQAGRRVLQRHAMILRDDLRRGRSMNLRAMADK